MFFMTTFALLRLKFTEVTPGKLVSMLKSAEGTVACAAALKAARAALASSTELHTQISSIHGPDTAPALHMPT